MNEKREDFLALEARARERRPKEDPAGAFVGEGKLSGAPMLKVARFLSDEELVEAAEYPPDRVTLTGRRVSEVAREEIERRAGSDSGHSPH